MREDGTFSSDSKDETTDSPASKVSSTSNDGGKASIMIESKGDPLDNNLRDSDLLPNLEFPRCSNCSLDWYICDDEASDNDTKREQPEKQATQRVSQKTKRNMRRRKNPSKYLLPLPWCQCQHTSLVCDMDKQFSSDKLVQETDETQMLACLKRMVEQKITWNNLAICRNCLDKRLIASKDVCEHDYHDKKQPNPKFTVEVKCVQCSVKFGIRKLDSLLKEGTTDEKWIRSIETSMVASRLGHRIRRSLRRHARKTKEKIENNRSAIYLTHSSDECFSSDSEDDTLRIEKATPLRVPPTEGELLRELLKRNPTFKQNRENEILFNQLYKTREGRREIGIDSDEDIETERERRREQEEKDAKLAAQLQEELRKEIKEEHRTTGDRRRKRTSPFDDGSNKAKGRTTTNHQRRVTIKKSKHDEESCSSENCKKKSLAPAPVHAHDVVSDTSEESFSLDRHTDSDNSLSSSNSLDPSRKKSKDLINGISSTQKRRTRRSTASEKVPINNASSSNAIISASFWATASSSSVSSPMPQQVTGREWEEPVYEEKPSPLEKPSKVSIDCSSSSDDAAMTKWDSEPKKIKRSKKGECVKGQKQLKKTPQEHFSDHSIHKMDESREEDRSKNAVAKLSGPERTKKAQMDKTHDPDCLEKNSNDCDMQLSPGVEHKDGDLGYHISNTDASTDHSLKVDETHPNELNMLSYQKPVNDTSTAHSSQSKGDNAQKSTREQLIELINDVDSDEDLVDDSTPPQSVCEKGNSSPSKIVTQTVSLDNLAHHSKVSNGEAELKQVVHRSCVSTSKNEKDLKPVRRDIEFGANKRADDIKKDRHENDKSIPVMGNLESEGVPESNPTICAVDQNAISQLINMGFSKEDSTRSYIDAGKDLEVAVAMMLSGQHS
eukprot:scaffold516555_cov55-Attheya_sp.AAC.2